VLYRYNSSAHPPDIHVVPTCGFEPVRAFFDSTSIGANETHSNLSQEIKSGSEGLEVFAGGLSSNWTLALPQRSTKAGSSLDGDDVVGGHR
jgi:hypothetical protein